MRQAALIDAEDLQEEAPLQVSQTTQFSLARSFILGLRPALTVVIDIHTIRYVTLVGCPAILGLKIKMLYKLETFCTH